MANGRERLARFELRHFILQLVNFSLQAGRLLRIVRLLLRASELLLQRRELLTNDFDALLGFFIHEKILLSCFRGRSF